MGHEKDAEKRIFRDSEAHSRAAVRGYDFDREFSFEEMLGTYKQTGFQATHLGQAIELVNQMLSTRGTKIYLGYTSNMVSSGLRDILRFLVKHSMVDVLVTTAGGVEEDLIKCLGDVAVGDFSLDGGTLYQKGWNRIGNLLMPNRNYCLFEEFLAPVAAQLLAEQQQGASWTPSKIIARLGREINSEESIYYWAQKNGIPVYCPALTDGSIGDILHFSSIRQPGLKIDILEDLNEINSGAKHAEKTGMVILGGGVVKHHICNANLMRNGADYSVYINTGLEADGSDSGASPDEAVSWGKIGADAQAVKVWGDATIIFPLLVAMSFAKKQRPSYV